MFLPPPQWRRLLVRGVSVILGLVVLCIVVERALELHDASRLTVNATFLSLGGRKLRYRETGAGRPGPTVVLISGTMAMLEQWDGVQNTLSTESPVLSYDRGGMGFSDPSDSYDASAEAEELDALLHATSLPPPFVLVSYSASSYLARVYAAAHPDLVKGVVFVDPGPTRSVAEKGRTTARAHAHMLLTMNWQALVGYLRFRMVAGHYLNHRPPMSQPEEREKYGKVSSHHWRGTLREVFALDRSRDEANATPPLRDVPVGVLTSMEPEMDTTQRVVLAMHQSFAAESKRGLLRTISGVDHTRVLEESAGAAAAASLIREITAEARASVVATSR